LCCVVSAVVVLVTITIFVPLLKHNYFSTTPIILRSLVKFVLIVRSDGLNSFQLIQRRSKGQQNNGTRYFEVLRSMS
jgi:hypothetical protein